jgi:hypothetical protein
MVLFKFLPSSLQLLVLPYLPLFNTHRSHGPLSHPLATLILLAVLFLIIYRTFRRKTG